VTNINNWLDLGKKDVEAAAKATFKQSVAAALRRCD
jgi:hypothetical protein